MEDDALRELAHNHGITERLFICNGDEHCPACKLWGDFSIRLAARVLDNHRRYNYDTWGEDE